MISDNTITGLAQWGMLVSNGSPTVTGNPINGSQIGIKLYNAAGGTYQQNTISGNTDYGMYYAGIIIIEATNNYWGSPTGPLDDSDDRASGG